VIAIACGCEREHRDAKASEPEPPPSVSVPTSTASTSVAIAPSAPPLPAMVDGCPSEMARVDRYCVDRWEAHLVEVRDGIETVHPYYERPIEGVRYVARSSGGVFPQAYVTKLDSEAACRAASKRLCTLTEWHRACLGAKHTTWPYGNVEASGKCNTGKEHVLAKLFGPNTKWKHEEHFNNPIVDQEPGFLAKTGEYGECKSASGVLDMVGNLHEWVSDRVDASLERKLPLNDYVRERLEKRHGNSIFMGGFFSTRNELGHGCGYVTIGHGAKYHDYSTGFRCCEDAR